MYLSKPDDLSLVPMTHVVETDNPPKSPCDFHMACMCVHVYT